MKLYSLLFFLLFQQLLFAQNEGNIWYFGTNAGLDFNSGIPVALTNGQMTTNEGCASICDPNGALLFYTDGSNVWNRNHSIMPNGNGLFGNLTSTQSAVIVKKPGAQAIYIIFTVDFEASSKGLRYSEVDMGLQNGLGDVTLIKNIGIVAPTCEKITAIKHPNNVDYWIVTHLYNSNTFSSYLLTSTGISATSIQSNVGSVIANDQHTIGYLKASLNGKKIAAANTYLKNAEIFDFDNQTGIVSNPILLDTSYFEEFYGIEFSPNNELLYISESFGKVYQYNLLASSPAALVNSKTLIGEYNGLGGGALQLGPDLKIYHAQQNSDSLGLIENPNILGTACNYISDGVWLRGKKSRYGLPTLINSFIDLSTLDTSTQITSTFSCLNDSMHFGFTAWNNMDSVLWIFDDPISGNLGTSTNENASHVFSEWGTYNVNLIVYRQGVSDTLSHTVDINFLPEIDLGDTIVLCADRTIGLDASIENATYLWQDSSSNSTFKVTRKGTYWVNVFINNCIVADTVIVMADLCEAILEMPNIFTPNNDGKNDLFLPVESDKIAYMETSIYNRWGVLVFETSNPKIEWDGGNVSEGTYFWLTQYSDFENRHYEKRGTVNIIR